MPDGNQHSGRTSAEPLLIGVINHFEFPMASSPMPKTILCSSRPPLKRPGYALDIERIIEHARQFGCFFEINSSPDRLDLSTENARTALAAAVKIASNTDAHSTREFGLIRYGLGQARRAGARKEDVLNCMPWADLSRLFRR
jgi:histidinol phosphatase-like PHP family hydrolase